MNLIANAAEPEPTAVRGEGWKPGNNQAHNDSFSGIAQLQRAQGENIDFYGADGVRQNHSFMEYGEEAEAVGSPKPKEAHPGLQKNMQRENNFLDQPEGEALDDEEDYQDIQKTLGQLQEPKSREPAHNPFTNTLGNLAIEPDQNP